MNVRYAHEMQAGDRYAPLRFTVTDELNQQFLFAVDDFDPLFLEGRDGRPPLVHPVLLMHMTPRTRSPSYRQAPGMGSAFARDSSLYRAPAHVGATLLVQWEVIKTYEQRGKIYQDYVATVRDDDGRELLRRELASTFFMQGKVKASAPGREPGDAARPSEGGASALAGVGRAVDGGSSASPSIGRMQPGDVLAGRPLRLSVARTLALSGGPFDRPGWPDRNLHTDIDAARAAGLSEVVVSGTQWEGHLVGLLVRTFGTGWFDGGQVDIKLTRSVKVGETVQPKLRLDTVVPGEDGARAELSVWCENGQGDQVLVGTATCRMPG